MLQKIGLLPQSNYEQLPFAYSIYKRSDKEGFELSKQFKRTFSIDVRIKFLGVWYVVQHVGQFLISHPHRDTVQSVGAIPKHTPFFTSNHAILHFRHAVALDEHRVKFIPTFCAGGILKKQDSEVSEHSEVIDGAPSQEGGRSRGPYANENEINAETGPATDVEEVFFAGVHCGTFRFSSAQSLLLTGFRRRGWIRTK